MDESINIHAAKTHLSRLIERVEQGEEVVISRAGRPVAKLVPFKPTRAPRKLGLYAGQIKIAPDFDTLPDDMMKAFRGEGESFALPGESNTPGRANNPR
ncbi:MAG: type II toxin-antitoxin system Phd/YefM family antitoxin [Rhodospirillaceae bacterium]|nr:type II toxin-antitoxin system Phd/YefM family antitoxin [Rhodospirillaceae bacterium]